MGKKTVFTNITPLPAQVSREVAIAMVHNHAEMISLNPLVIKHQPIRTPRDAAKDEFLDCAWYEMTDKVPVAGPVKKKVTYRGCFHDLPNGLQTHVYAPMGLDIRERWTICGALPGEPDEPRELGLNTPRRGLYLREDAEIKVNMLMTAYVRKNLDAAHKVLVERILAKAERIQAHLNRGNALTQQISYTSGSPGFQRGSHMAESNIVQQLIVSPGAGASPRSMHSRMASESSVTRPGRSPLREGLVQELPASTPRELEKPLPERPQIDEAELRSVHPALRQQYIEHRASGGFASDSALPNYHTIDNQRNEFYNKDMAKPQAVKSFPVELEGSVPESSQRNAESDSPSNSSGFVRQLPGQETSSWRPETVYGPVSEISDETPLIEERSISHSRSQSQPLPPDNGANDTQSRTNRAVNRFSIVSGISDFPTPKPDQSGFENGVNSRLSVVSDLSDGPSPKFKQQTFAFAQQQARLAEQRHRENYI